MRQPNMTDNASRQPFMTDKSMRQPYSTDTDPFFGRV